jgi:RNA polymerase sigma-70 factor (ECF subfamily)
MSVSITIATGAYCVSPSNSHMRNRKRAVFEDRFFQHVPPSCEKMADARRHILGATNRSPPRSNRGRDRMTADDRAPVWLAQLFDAHGAALVLYARQWCSTPEDVVQEALLELVCQRRRPDNPVAWLYRVVRNGAISAARGQTRRQRREEHAARTEAWFQTGASKLDAAEAAAALAALPVELREVIVARIWGSLTYAEIAELVGTSLSTAQRRYEQGIRELQTRLENPCETKTSD